MLEAIKQLRRLQKYLIVPLSKIVFHNLVHASA
jgi:hypothetical protein